MRCETSEVRPDLDQDGVAAEQLELLHGVGMEGNNRVVIIDGFINYKPIGGLLPLQDRGTEVLLRALTEIKETETNN